MDPLSISTGAAALLTICLQAVQLVKTTIENMKDAKKLLIKLLNQTERMRLLLEQLRSLTHQLHGRNNLLLPFNDSACKETVTELQALVHDIVKTTTFLNLQVLLNKRKADDLLQRLHRHEEEIVVVLMCVTTETTLKTEAEVKLMTQEATSRAEAITLFDAFSITESSTTNRLSGQFRNCLTWPGCTSRSQFDQVYLSLRDKLSDAAYYGRWSTVFDVLQTAETSYSQSWANFPRITIDPNKSSGWTPLHQLVFMCASEDEIRKLLARGGLRTLRTTWAQEFTHHDMTPIEMARELGYTHLYNILSPVIRHNLPAKTLGSLQDRFHEIIRNNLVEGRHLRYPELVVLTELEEPVMWFPLSPPETNDVKGYLYRLDGRELVVISYGLDAVQGSKKYRISEDRVVEVEEPVVFNT